MTLLRWFLHSACHVLGFARGSNDHAEYPAVTSKVSVGEKETQNQKKMCPGFRMPLHYPRYTKTDYEEMEEWKLDLLLSQYGLCLNSTLEERRAFAMGAFLWA